MMMRSSRRLGSPLLIGYKFLKRTSTGPRFFSSSCQNLDDSQSFLEKYKASLDDDLFQSGQRHAQTPNEQSQDIVIERHYGFLGKRRDISSSLSFANLDLPMKNGGQVQLVLKTGTKNHKKPEDHQLQQDFKNIRPGSAVMVEGTAKYLPKTSDDGVRDKFHDKHRDLLVRKIKCVAEFPEDIIVSGPDSFGPDQRHLQMRFDRKLRKRLRCREHIVRKLRQECERFSDLREVETPILFKSTPEGAREFLVPTRTPGHAYALPQSPQQYKQILMAGGFSGYFQFARCFRDEDLRADRQPEFTQFDLELPFHDGKMVRSRIETIIQRLWDFAISEQWDTFNFESPTLPIPTMTYETVMRRYGSDKPDLRIPGMIHAIESSMSEDAVSMLTSIESPAIDAFAIRIEGDANEARSFVRSFMSSPEGKAFLQNADGAPGVSIYDSSKPLEGLQTFGHEGAEKLKSIFKLWHGDDALQSNNSEKSSSEPVEETSTEGEPFIEGDIIFTQAHPSSEFFSGGSTTTGRLRNAVYKAALEAGLVKHDERHHFLWVIDFPLFTPDNSDDPGQGGRAGFSATHHPFTAPKESKDVDLLLTDPLRAVADHYDLVLNGVELGGGSKRIHDSEVQQFVMRDVLKMPEERLQDFAHLFEVLRAACPPHAGFALGLDRLVAVMTGVESVRDVIPFPKNGKGEDMLVKSPGVVTEEQLRTYHLRKDE